MLIAIIDEIENNITVKNYVYMNYITNNINITVKRTDNDKSYFLKKEDFINLINDIVNCEKKYFGKYKQYDIFIDDVNNKHFFKNNIEDYSLFFEMNGEDALLYLRTSMIYNSPKRFSFKNLKTNKYIKICCYSILCPLLFYISFNSSDYIKYAKNNIETIYYRDFIVSSDDIINNILESDLLNENQKNILINEKMLDDVLETADGRRKHEIYKNVKNLSIKYYTEKELKRKSDASGFYSELNPNCLHVKNEETDVNYPSVSTHEFCHLLQDPNDYYYIREACAEINNNEYYGYDIIAYTEEVRIVKVLMEIIGPRPVFECCFKGNAKSFKEAIYNNLEKEDAKELLSLFKKSPAYTEDEERDDINYNKINPLLDKLYYNIYGENIINNNVINSIRNLDNEKIYRGYFNDEFIEKCCNKKSIIKNTIPLEDAINNGVVSVVCELVDNNAKKVKRVDVSEAVWYKNHPEEGYNVLISVKKPKNKKKYYSITFIQNNDGYYYPYLSFTTLEKIPSIHEKFSQPNKNALIKSIEYI